MMKMPIVFLASLLLPYAASADIYKCRLTNGSTEISTSPCGSGSSTIKSIPADTVSEASRRQAERDAAQMEEHAARLEAKRLAQEESERKEREKQAAAAGLPPPAPSAASIESCLHTLDRMALDPNRRIEMENSCRNTGAAPIPASLAPDYSGVPHHLQPHPLPPPPHPLPAAAPTPAPPGSKPASIYQVPNNYQSR